MYHKTKIVKQNEFLADLKTTTTTTTTKLANYFSNISMETIFMNTKNSKSNEPHLLLTCRRY